MPYALCTSGTSCYLERLYNNTSDTFRVPVWALIPGFYEILRLVTRNIGRNQVSSVSVRAGLIPALAHPQRNRVF